MNILVTRPLPDAETTAQRLIALGHHPVIAPVLTITATGAVLPAITGDAFLVTSANALRALTVETVMRLKGRPLYCVGTKTAAMARELGLQDCITAGGTGKSLAARVVADLPTTARLVYLAGSPRKPVLEAALSEVGFTSMTVELYRAEPITAWPITQLDAIKSCETVLHYSRQSVEVYLTLADPLGSYPLLEHACHICLSDDVAEPLRQHGVPHLAVASHPTEDAMISALK